MRGRDPRRDISSAMSTARQSTVEEHRVRCGPASRIKIRGDLTVVVARCNACAVVNTLPAFVTGVSGGTVNGFH